MKNSGANGVGGKSNPNSGKIMNTRSVKTSKPGSKGSGSANNGQIMTSKNVAGKGTKSRAKSSGGVNTPPKGANPSPKGK